MESRIRVYNNSTLKNKINYRVYIGYCYKALKLVIPNLRIRIFIPRRKSIKWKEADYNKSLASPLLAS